MWSWPDGSEPAVKELTWADSFKKHCLLRDECVVVHTHGKFKKPAWFAALMRKHRRYTPLP